MPGHPPRLHPVLIRVGLYDIRPPPPIMVLIVLIALPEAVLQGADLGLWGSARWRGLSYAYGAFWIGLLGDWRPNFTAQPVTMFASYALLHGGWAHLAVNAVTLVSLGPPVLARLGTGRFLALFAGAALGGAAGFALLADTPRPMVGVSGALFGLAGAWVVMGALEARAAALEAIDKAAGLSARAQAGLRAALAALAWPVGMLMALNLAMIALTPGGIAWQAHLGGGLAGAVLGAVLGRVQGAPGTGPPDDPSAV